MKKLVIAALGAAMLAGAQPDTRWFDYLPVIRQYLDLSPAQVEDILRSNAEHDQWIATKQARLAQVQSEIWQERARTSPDPVALGVRFVEIEAICRELAARMVEQRRKNRSLLTEAQGTKLKALEDALELVPAIQQAQMLRMLGEPSVLAVGTETLISATGDAFSRTDGTRLGLYADPACGGWPIGGVGVPGAMAVP